MLFTVFIVSVLLLQAPPNRVTVESKDENPFRKVLGTPARASVKNSSGTGAPSNRVNVAASPTSSVPHRTGLLESREECFPTVRVVL